LKASKLQNNKTKNSQNPQEQIPPPSPPFSHTKNKLKTPKMTRRKIENFEISKYENKKLLKFTRRKANTPLSSLVKTSHNVFLKIHKMTRRKLKALKLLKNKKSPKVHKIK
jgi:hypothetical protein